MLFFVFGATGKLGRHVVAGCSTDQERSVRSLATPECTVNPIAPTRHRTQPAICIVPRAADLTIPISTKHRPRRN